MPHLSQRLARIAFAGQLGWVALLFVRLTVEPGVSEEAAHLLLLVPLGLVPLYLDASVPASFAPAPRALVLASWLLMPGALGAAASFLVPEGPLAGALAAAWAVAALALAAWAITDRLRQRTRRDLAEGALGAGWAVFAWAALILAVNRAGGGGTEGLLGALAAHYGALTLVWAGLLGRTLEGQSRRVFDGLVVLLMGGLLVFFFAPRVSGVVLGVVAVGLGGVGLARFGRLESRATGLMLAISAGALALAGGLAVWLVGAEWIDGRPADLGWAVERGGWLVAFGVGLWGAIGWRRVRPRAGAGVEVQEAPPRHSDVAP